MEVAYGQMGLTPMMLADMTPFDFLLSRNGFIQKCDREENYFRKHARIVLSTHVDPKSKIEMSEIWPTHYDAAKDQVEAVLTKQNIDASIEAWKNRKKVN